MAILSKKSGKRPRITFNMCDKDAARLESLKQLAKAHGFAICFRDDFSRWFSQQLDQLEKSMKTQLREKGGNNG